MTLDFYQQKAAYQNEFYSIIIAGAGTGKTYTLLGRIEYLIQHQNLKPEEIVVISYTNETVRDFKEKLLKELGYTISVFTFHKFALSILESLSYSFSLAKEDELEFLVQEFLHSYCVHNSSLKKLILGSFSFLGKYGIGSYQKLMDHSRFINFQKEIIMFIHLWRAKGFSTNNLFDLIHNSHGKTKSFFQIIFILLECYSHEKKSQCLFDFDDLILVATKNLKKIDSFCFRHILIDEFQDSSYLRIKFLQEMVDQFSLSFTVVGDDCQSIYGFSGTENYCFSLLTDFFPSIKTFYLKNTYRNSQELIQVANQFILKNPIQIRKEIFSSNHLEKPIEVLYYIHKSKIYAMLKYIICKEKSTHLLFLGRNSFDWKYYFKKNEIQWINQKEFTLIFFPNQIFTYLTVHQSKGLEYDIVILLHLENSIYGFPNQIPLSKPFQKILTKEKIAYEEERRLFYVALTRTKTRIYLITPYFNSSIFVKEILKDNKEKMKVTFFY